MKYIKKILSIPELIQLLQSRNLIINNKEYAEDILTTIGYFRLKAYFIPFFSKKDTFIIGTTFEDIVNLYMFDSELKTLLSFYIGNIEIEFKANINYSLIELTNDYFCYLNSSTYSSKKEILDKTNDFLNYRNNHLNDLFKKSDEQYIKHFKKNYLTNHNHNQTPGFPIWMFLETITFGTLSKFYEVLGNKFKKKVAKKYFLDDSVLGSWLHCLSYIRNVIAHYSRLWNKKLRVPPKIPIKNIITKEPIIFFLNTSNKEISENNLFTIISIICYLNKFIKNLNNNRDLKNELTDLFKKYDIDNSKHLQDMGFDSDWLNFNIWKNKKILPINYF